MTTLWLTEMQAQQLIDHARSEAPCEACGLLAVDQYRVQRVIPASNAAAEPETHYEIARPDLARFMPEIERSGCTVAFYHSHPQSGPILSQTDIRDIRTHWYDTIYLIIGLRNAKAEMAAWTIHRDGTVERVWVHVGLNPPVVDDQEPPSRAQKIAMIAAGVIAFTLLIALSLVLLPPAPSIPSP
jgi:proteasome lid subunit RPN8/RPN11